MQNGKYCKAELRKVLLRETKFISDVLGKIHVLNRGDNDVSDEEEGDVTSKKKVIPKFNDKSVRATNLEELQKQFNSLKGKKNLEFAQKMLKKRLKKKLKKKNKKEKLKLQKKSLVKVSKITDKNIKTEPGTETAVSTKPVFNSDVKMMFSKIELPNENKHSQKKKKKDVKDPHKLLTKLKKQDEKLKNLETEGKVEIASVIKEKQAWTSAIKKAKGEKVKDDPSLLKKSIKRREAEKRRSQKKWQERKKGVEKSIKEKQAKRKANIEGRKKQVKLKKLKKAAKKGRIIPGL